MTVIVCFCTCPSLDVATSLARGIVADGLVACANVIPQVISIYRWQGEMCEEQEALLLMKTTRERYAALETALKDRHPYELLELIAVPVDMGLPQYLEWVATCTA